MSLATLEFSLVFIDSMRLLTLCTLLLPADGVLKGQGAFHSSIRDMAAFLGAHLTLLGAGGPGDAASLPLPAPLSAAMRAAVSPLAPDEFEAQRGEVASAWQIYRAGGAAVWWKSGGTAGYGSFMAFCPATGRAAVALGSCGNCGAKAVQQLTRQLVDGAPTSSPLPAPPLRPETLAAYTGCFTLPDAKVSAVFGGGGGTPTMLRTAVAGDGLALNVSGANGNGSASLRPFPLHKPASATVPPLPCALPLGWALDDDSVVVRPPGVSGGRVAAAHSPLQEADLRYGWRESYFLCDQPSGAATALVLHIDGWDLFAPRVPCPKSDDASPAHDQHR